MGAGPSGKDMALEIEKFANRITLSHHRDLGGLTFTNNLKQQGDITRFTENGAIFANGDEETFTYVLFCTGILKIVFSSCYYFQNYTLF